MTRLRPFSRLVLAVVALALFTTGCDSSGSTDTSSPPEVVPAEAFQLDTDLFSDQAPGMPTAKAGERTNFANAALRVWPVSLVVKANLIIPAAVTAAALQADPMAEDGTWVWDSSTTSNNQNLTFRLEGMPDGDRVFWSMFVTATNPARGEALDDFELYTAETALDGSSGSWSLFYQLGGERTRVLDANFTVTSDTEKEITFSVPETADENAGDSVRYAVNGARRIFVWRDAAPEGDTVVIVTWNADTKAGSIIAPGYNNGEEACWNEAFENVACAN